MKVVVCIRQSADGEINPFDASAYETALRISGAEITLLSMGPPKTAAFLENLTRLGAKEAVLLTDKAFAGADTLATAYTLSLAINKIKPDLIICGRQSVDGDTGQVGPSLSVNAGYGLLTNIMSVVSCEKNIVGVNRAGETVSADFPALITVEKSLNLRLPSIRSKTAPVIVLGAADLNADLSRCGLAGSPTRVIKTFENEQDRRRCKIIASTELKTAIEDGLKKGAKKITPQVSEKKLKNVWIVGDTPRAAAQTVAETVTVVEMDSPDKMTELIKNGNPDAVLWGSDPLSKAIAPQVAALLKTGLCADCTALETDGDTLYMYRPACSGNIIAKIRCITSPPMATVRTAEESRKNIIIGIGYGARDSIPEIKAFAEKIGAGIAATRKTVDNDYLPYELQVGLTGKSVNPDVYIALGISGAVYHIAGIRQSGTIIAVNPDRGAPIFKYADYGIVAEVKEIFT
ncbi:MAG: FAD-binding protein [Acutalibacteraceae bacterium]